MEKNESIRKMNIVGQIIAVNVGRDKKFGNTNPFQRITRLAEETGELAGEVNHFENQGVKGDKHGEPSKDHLAREVFDVVAAAFSLAQHYRCLPELYKQIQTTYDAYIADGLIDLTDSEGVEDSSTDG